MDEQDSIINGTGLFADDLPLVNEIFNDLLNPHNIYSVYDNFSTTKVYDSAHPIFDRTKLTVLYALIHHYGKRYPENMSISFIDDREDIREPLINVFETNKNLIRAGIQLNIWPYNGSLLFETPTIHGSDPTDFNYKANIKNLVKMCRHDLKHHHHSVDIANQLSEAEIKHFATDRILQNSKQTHIHLSLFKPHHPRKENPPHTLHRVNSAPSLH